MTADAATSLHLVEGIVALGACVSSLELLHIRTALRDDGLLSWRVHRLSHPVIALFVQRIAVDHLLHYPGVLLLIVFRLILAVGLAALAITNHSTVLPLIALVVVTLLMTLRSPQGNDGSDQMASIILVASGVAEVASSSFSKSVALTFIAAQASLAYGTSGFLKLGAAGWRDGSFVTEILKTSSFGNDTLLQYVQRRPSLAKALGWGVVYGDCALAFAVALPPVACIVLLVFGVMLHLGIARMLGLNTFLWSFAATYPAVFWVSTSLYHYVWN